MANKEPMVAFLEEADKMIRGIVTDGVSLLISFSSTAIYQLFCKVGQAVGGARVRVEERGKDLVASSRGEFWRLLTPGLFSLVILVGQPLDRLVDYLVCILGRLV